MHSDCWQRGRDPSSTETPPMDSPGGRPLESEVGEVGVVGAEHLEGSLGPPGPCELGLPQQGKEPFVGVSGVRLTSGDIRPQMS